MTGADFDRAALLRAVIDCPDDDLPRLAFADWLEENGEAASTPLSPSRSSVIRDDWCPRPWQFWEWCFSPTIGRAFTGSPSVGLEADPTRHATWAASVNGGVWTFGIRRGFIQAVRLPLAAALEHLPGLVREYPITRVEITDREPAKNMLGCWPDGEEWDRDRWGWARPCGQGAVAWVIPDAVADLLPHGLPASECWWAYPSREAAIDDLSAALLRHCRSSTPT